MTQIPIYRAKKIDSDEYVEGFYVESIQHISNIQVNNSYFEKIDQSTLSIHFPDMIDSKGNKIFASLSEDGKGGDIVDMGYNRFIETMKLCKTLWVYNYAKSKVIGIQQ